MLSTTRIDNTSWRNGLGRRRAGFLTTAALLVAAVLTVGAPAVEAQELPAPNALGLYFDNEAANNNLSLGGPATVQAYLIFTQATVAAITGWEVKVTATAGTAITDVALPVGTTAILAGPEQWSAVLSEPMPGNPLTKLAVFTLTTDGASNTLLYLGNIDNPSAAGDLPGVRLGDGTWNSLPVASGDPDSPVAGINSDTPTDTPTWGTVKALFR